MFQRTQTFTDAAAPAAVNAPVTACFAVRASAEPGVMPRVLELFAKRNLVPTRFHSVVEANDSLVIDIQMENMSARDREYLAACMRQLYDVDAVLTSEKASAA
jgi:acetolactate synthase regulatory subunit